MDFANSSIKIARTCVKGMLEKIQSLERMLSEREELLMLFSELSDKVCHLKIGP